jgi:hypothetical protein
LDGKATFEVQCFLSVNFRNRSCFGMGMGGKGGDGGSTFEIGTMVFVIFDNGIMPNRKLFP